MYVRDSLLPPPLAVPGATRRARARPCVSATLLFKVHRSEGEGWYCSRRPFPFFLVPPAATPTLPQTPNTPKSPNPQPPLPPPCRVLPSFPLPRAADAADADAPATIRRAPGLSPFPCSVAVGSPSSEIPLRARGGRGPGAPDVFWLLWHVAPAIRRAGGAAAAGRGAKRGRRPPPRASGAPSPASRRRCARTARCSPAPGGRCW